MKDKETSGASVNHPAPSESPAASTTISSNFSKENPSDMRLLDPPGWWIPKDELLSPGSSPGSEKPA